MQPALLCTASCLAAVAEQQKKTHRAGFMAPRPAEETFETRRKGQEREPQKGKSGGVEGGLVRASSIRWGGGRNQIKK